MQYTLDKIDKTGNPGIWGSDSKEARQGGVTSCKAIIKNLGILK